MIRRTVLLLLASSALFTSSCSATITLTDVYLTARTDDNKLRGASFAYDAALEKRPQARAGLLPSLTGYVNPQRVDGKVTFIDEPSTPRRFMNTGWTLELVTPLFRPKNWLALDDANKEILIAQIQYRQAEQELLLRVARVYFDVLKAEQQADATAVQLRNAEHQLHLAEQALRVGSMTSTALNEAATRQAELFARSVEADADLRSKQAALARLLRRRRGNIDPITDDVFVMPSLRQNAQQWQTAARENSLEVQVKKLAVSLADSQVKKNWTAHAPTVDLVVSRLQNKETGNMDLPLTLTTRKAATQIELRAVIPLFAGGGDQSRIREAVALRSKAEADLDAEADDAEQQALETFTSITTALQRIQYLRTALNNGSTNLDMLRIGLQVGTSTEKEQLEAESQVATLRRDIRTTQFDVMLDGLKLKALVGALSIEDLEQLDKTLGTKSASSGSALLR